MIFSALQFAHLLLNCHICCAGMMEGAPCRGCDEAKEQDILPFVALGSGAGTSWSHANMSVTYDKTAWSLAEVSSMRQELEILRESHARHGLTCIEGALTMTSLTAEIITAGLDVWM